MICPDYINDGGWEVCGSPNNPHAGIAFSCPFKGIDKGCKREVKLDIKRCENDPEIVCDFCPDYRICLNECREKIRNKKKGSNV
jgi:hypothetical protein